MQLPIEFSSISSLHDLKLEIYGDEAFGEEDICLLECSMGCTFSQYVGNES